MPQAPPKPISPQAADKRERYRSDSGRFGEQPHEKPATPELPDSGKADLLKQAQLALDLGKEKFNFAFPYLVGMLGSFDTCWTDELPTLAVSPDRVLWVNPAYLMQLEKEDPRLVVSALYHEMGHYLLSHNTRLRGRDHQLWNMAGDLEINGTMEINTLPCHQDWLLPSRMGFKSNLPAETYYELMKEKMEEQQQQSSDGQEGSQGQGQGQGAGDGQSDGQPQGNQQGQGGGGDDSDGDGSEGQGQGGGSSGEQNSQNEAGGGGSGPLTKSQQEFYANGGCGSCAHGDEHGDPSKQPAGRGREGEEEARQKAERIRRETAKAAEEYANSQSGRGIGVLPGFMQRLIEECNAPPKLNWRAMLRSALNRAVAKTPGNQTINKTRLARTRYPDRRMVKLKREDSKLTALIVVDTSASMEGDELSAVRRELDGFFKRAKRFTTGSVTFASGDTDLADHAQVSSTKQALGHVAGGGGTDMIGVLEQALEKCPTPPDVSIVMTDGYTFVPERNPFVKQGVNNILFVVIGPRASAQDIVSRLPKWVQGVPVPTDE